MRETLTTSLSETDSQLSHLDTYRRVLREAQQRETTRLDSLFDSYIKLLCEVKINMKSNLEAEYDKYADSMELDRKAMSLSKDKERFGELFAKVTQLQIHLGTSH